MKEFRLPKISLTDEAVTIVAWLKEVGEPVRAGEPLLEIETDKAAVEVEADEDGLLLRRVRLERDSVKPGEILGYIGAPEELDLSPPEPPPHEDGGQPPPSTPAAGVGVDVASRPGPIMEESRGSRYRVSGGWRAPTDDCPGGGALGGLPRGSGRQSRGPSPDEQLEFSDAPLSRDRSRTARLLERAALIPQFSVTREIALNAAARDAANNTIAGLSDAVIYATTRAVKVCPRVNGWMLSDVVRTFDQVNVAYAVDLPTGVVAPVIRDAGRLTLAEIADRRRQLVGLAKGSRLHRPDLEGATLTISNVGPLGSHFVVPIVTPPQVAVIGIGARRGSNSSQTIMVTFVGDHRVLDGADGARFLAAFESELQSLQVK